MKSNITMKDIAKELNISIVTVSKALNDKDGVSLELRNKIKELATKMGYRYNMVAKAMRDGLSYNVGVLIPDHFIGGDDKSFYFNIFKNISKSLEKNNYCGILQVLSLEDEEKLELPKFYYDKKVDGIIILGQVCKNYIKALQEIDIPIVFIDFYDENTNIDSVTVDNFYAAYHITNYLIKRGHVDIAFVGDIYATSSIQDRYLGFCKSLLEHEIRLSQDYIICDRDSSGKYIDIKFPDKMPTAFVANCDGVAFNVIDKLKKKGYKIPEDISVVGFDDDIYATLSEPQITTTRIDVEKMARTSVTYIMNKILNESQKYGQTLIKGKIIYRDSVSDRANK